MRAGAHSTDIQSVAGARGVYHDAGGLTLRHGARLSELSMAFETWGRLNQSRSNAILVLGGLSPDAHARSSEHNTNKGWWENMIGPGLALDTEEFFVICVNNLGSCFGSTGPSSVDPGTGAPYGPDFPIIAMEDLARAAQKVVLSFGIERLHGLVGTSMGGLVALAYGLVCPNSVERISLISSGPRCQAHAIAVHALQRQAICSDPKWNGGRYARDDGPLTGLKLARKIGMTSYRSADELERRFANQRVDLGTQRQWGFDFQIESYLEGSTRRFVERFDANSYLYLSRAMDYFDAAEHGETLTHALRKVDAQAVQVIGVETDSLFPLAQQNALAEAFEDAELPVQFVALDSEKGHDAFLTETALFTPVLREFFR